MANYGALGPSGALAAAQPPPQTPEERLPETLLQSVGLKTPEGAPTPGYSLLTDLFAQVTGNLGAVMDEAQFVALAKQHFDLDCTWATAAFRAADVDASGRLNRHEFAFLSRALIYFVPETDIGCKELLELRQRALFARFATPCGVSGVLDASARQQLVRTLSSRDSHVHRILTEQLRWPVDDSIPMSFAQFKQEVDSGALGTKALLHLRDAFATTTTATTRPKVVHDPRSVLGAAHKPGGPPTLAAAASAVAGPAAVSAAFVLDDALRAPSDWRGAIAAPHGSPAHELSQRVVGVAHAMALELQNEADVSDSEWKRGGLALSALLGSDEPRVWAERVEQLANEAQRVAMAQPMVARVPAPAKIFGDTHGQLRDLLMLFAHYGFPSHRGGDVETTSYVFNGDYVDRGAHQLEVVVVLFALKCLYPARVFLNRGNHEFKTMSESMGQFGFKRHCEHRFGAEAAQGGVCSPASLALFASLTASLSRAEARRLSSAELVPDRPSSHRSERRSEPPLRAAAQRRRSKPPLRATAPCCARTAAAARVRAAVTARLPLITCHR